MVRDTQDGKKRGYDGYFQKSSKDDDQNSSEDQVVTEGSKRVLTDDDIIKACGGRTAHK